MTTKTWIIFAAICVGIVGGLIYLSGGNKIDISAVDTNAILQGSEKNGQIADHVYGNKDSKVILIEYGDYQCPGCKNAYPAIKEVVEKYKDKIGFVFRNFPLYSAHANALAAATSAEAAAGGAGWRAQLHRHEDHQARIPAEIFPPQSGAGRLVGDRPGVLPDRRCSLRGYEAKGERGSDVG